MLSPDPDASWGQSSDPTGDSGWVAGHGASCTQDSSPEATV